MDTVFLNTNPLKKSNKSESRAIITLAIPTIIAQLAQAGLGVIDTIMAGHHSAEALAAIALGTNLFNPVIVFVIGIMLVLNPMSAQLNGKKSWGDIRALLHNGIMLSLLLVIPSFIILRSFEPLLYLLGIDASVIAVAQGYLEALSWGLPGLYLFFALRFINEGLFSNKIVMYVALSALPLNVLVNYWFMYGGLGLAPMGAVGVGWATDVAYLYMFVILLVFTAKTSRYDHIGFFKHWPKPDVKTVKEMLKLGLPMGLSIGLEIMLFAAVGLMVGSYGIAQMAGHQIAINISSLGYMIPLGLSFALTARVGFHIGTGNPEQAKRSGYLGIGMSFFIMSFNAVLLISFPTVFASLYSEDKAVLAVATQLLFFAGLFQLSDGAQVTAMGALRGIKDTKIPMYISAFAYWVIGFPAGYWMAEYQGYGIRGYWMSMIFGLSVAAVMLIMRFVKLSNLKGQGQQDKHDTVVDAP
ncbi:MAG: MATE family efflux transporter [Algicola sp.]|nr:MATE family efflux transporter [Algicola sp.]